MKEKVYIIPSTFKEGSIIYSPLNKCAFWVNKEYAEAAQRYIQERDTVLDGYYDLKERIDSILSRSSLEIGERNFSAKNNVVLILSQRCNMLCEYCYANEAHSSEVMDKETLKASIDYIMAFDEKYKRISFIGGGEPILTWDLLQWAVEYAEIYAKKNNFIIEFSLTTNGTLLTAEKAKWLKKHGFRISVSFEILPDIQNKQRPLADKTKSSFLLVDEGIKNLLNNGIIPGLRSTVTEKNVEKMYEMVKFAIENYPKVKSLHFEHVSDISMNNNQYYEKFVDSYFKALMLANEYGINLKNSITHSTNYVRNCFCKGEFCVTPTGDVVSCHRVSSKRETKFNCFLYGNINDKFESIRSISNVLQKTLPFRDDCDKCFAMVHCAGGCAYNRLLYSTEQLDALCEFTKKMIVKNLEYKLLHLKVR